MTVKFIRSNVIVNFLVLMHISELSWVLPACDSRIELWQPQKSNLPPFSRLCHQISTILVILLLKETSFVSTFISWSWGCKLPVCRPIWSAYPVRALLCCGCMFITKSVSIVGDGSTVGGTVHQWKMFPVSLFRLLQWLSHRKAVRRRHNDVSSGSRSYIAIIVSQWTSALAQFIRTF